jgi:UDPglucose--hexose-1-phosphate uridylyltransferase
MSDIRYNILDDSYVIISPERLHRPEYMAWKKVKKKILSCPFCEGNEEMTPGEIFAIRDRDSHPNQPGWSIRVVPNLYKAVQIETPNTSRTDGIYKVFEGFGAHEVIIDTPKHFETMREWDKDTYTHWLLAIQSRIIDLRYDHRLSFISIFKNEGSNAGATQAHSHSQLIALPIIPHKILHRYNYLHRHYKETGHSLIANIISQEQHDDKRIINENSDFIAFCPYASAYPFEVMVATKKGISGIAKMDHQNIEQLAQLMNDLMPRMYQQLGNFDFNLSLCVSPMQKTFQTISFFDDIDAISHFMIHITPRIYRHGGFEVSTGIIINPVSPEESARLLRGENA